MNVHEVKFILAFCSNVSIVSIYCFWLELDKTESFQNILLPSWLISLSTKLSRMQYSPVNQLCVVVYHRVHGYNIMPLDII